MLNVPALTIYEHKESVCCHKVALTLAEKAIECKVINVSLENNEQKQPWFLSINPAGKVPALVHDGRVVTQSSVMTEYLDDCFPNPPLMPRCAYGRARRRLWARWIDDEMHSPHISTISFTIAFGQLFRKRMDTEEKLNAYLDSIKDDKIRAHAIRLFQSDVHSEQMRKSLFAYKHFIAVMEEALQSSTWLAGDTFSLADIDVIPYIWRLANLQLDFMWMNSRRVRDWFERVTVRAAFRKSIAEPAIPEWIETMRATGAEAKATIVAILEGPSPG